MRISDWSSDVCSSDLLDAGILLGPSNDPDINHYELTRFGFRIVGPIALKDQIESADWEALAAMPWITPLDTSMAYAPVLVEMRSEERRVGKECVRTCQFRWSPHN